VSPGTPDGAGPAVATYARVTTNGYVVIRKKGTTYAHRLVAERALGKPLPRRAVVHHVDDDPTHNANGNLVVCENQAYHLLLHQRMRALLACGNPDALRCWLCGNHDVPDRMYVRVRKQTGGRTGRHRECHAHAMGKRNAERRAECS